MFYGTMAEWLRRETRTKLRDLLGSARAGSNPAGVVIFFLLSQGEVKPFFFFR